MKRSFTLIIAIAVLCMLVGCNISLTDNNDKSNIIYDSDNVTVTEADTEPAEIYVTEPYHEPTLKETLCAQLCAHKWVLGKKSYTFNMDNSFTYIYEKTEYNEDTGNVDVIYPAVITGKWVMYDELTCELDLRLDENLYATKKCGWHVIVTNEEIESGSTCISDDVWTVTDKYLILKQEIFTAED